MRFLKNRMTETPSQICNIVEHLCTIFAWQFGNCVYITESAERGRNTRFDQIGAFGLTPHNYRVFASSPLSAFLFGVINKPLVPFFPGF